MAEAVVGAEVGRYVYGVVQADGQVPGLRGLDDAEVEYVEEGDLALAVSPLALDRPPGRRAELVAHSRVVDALAGAGPVVPVQFGSILGVDDEDARALLHDGGAHFGEMLRRLCGTVQLNLRATYVEEQVLAEVVQQDPQIADLRRRTRDLPPDTMHPDLVRLGELVSRAMEARRVQDGDLLLASVLPLVVEHRIRAGGGVDHLLDTALLVETARVEELEQALEDLAEAWHERIRLRLVGPVAPYDFVRADAWG